MWGAYARFQFSSHEQRGAVGHHGAGSSGSGIVWIMFSHMPLSVGRSEDAHPAVESVPFGGMMQVVGRLFADGSKKHIFIDTSGAYYFAVRRSHSHAAAQGNGSPDMFRGLYFRPRSCLWIITQAAAFKSGFMAVVARGESSEHVDFSA